MNEDRPIQHTVSLAGVVRDAVTRQRLPRVLVKIVAGPPAFTDRIAARAANPNWAAKRAQLERIWAGAKRIPAVLEAPSSEFCWTQQDGVFYFADLLPGDYSVAARAVLLRSQYGELPAPLTVSVAATPAGPPVAVAQADMVLPPTRVHGVVTRIDTGDPVAGANVRLLSSSTYVRSLDDGAYAIAPLIGGPPDRPITPTLEVIAPKFIAFRQRIQLIAGKDLEVAVGLTPQ